MARLKLDILGLCETRWSGEGHFSIGDKLVISSGSQDGGYGGVAVVLSAAVKNKSSLGGAHTGDSCSYYHHPSARADLVMLGGGNRWFLGKMQAVIDAMKSHQVCAVMSDFNAKLAFGRDFESEVGDYGLGQRNERWAMLAEFCRINGLCSQHSFSA
ncbi:craniofacial development protein 2-like [Sycon ciliatum]|uniref:craniofacial development protein 2-like n=1 Tax=Sycon ciliatum TaxID=27933 RepID=UPI0031F71FD9